MLLWPALVLVLGLFVTGTEAEPYPPASASIVGEENTVTTFYGNTDTFTLPCKTRITEIFTERGIGDQETCHLQVIGTNKLIGQRIQLAEVEVSFEVIGPESTEGVSFKVDTNAYTVPNPSAAKYVTFGKDTGKSQKPHTDDDDNDGSGSGDDDDDDDGDKGDDEEEQWGGVFEPLDIGYDEVVNVVIGDDGQAKVYIPSCHIWVNFTGPHTAPANATSPVGLTVEVDQSSCEDCAPPLFSSIETYILESPDSTIQATVPSAAGMTVKQQFVHIALTEPADQEDTPVGNMCEEAGTTYRTECIGGVKGQTAIETGQQEILDNDPLKLCLEGTLETADRGEKTMKAFNYLLWSSCSPSHFPCEQLNNTLGDCFPYVSEELQSFINDCI